MQSDKYTRIIIFCILSLGVGIIFGYFIHTKEVKNKSSEKITETEQQKKDLKFFPYEIPEIDMKIFIPVPLKNHISHIYQERPDQSWLTREEMGKTAWDAGLEKCISRGEKIREVIFRYDEPFYYGDDEKGYTELGSLAQVKNMTSDDCTGGKGARSYFVNGDQGKVYKYTSFWSNSGGFMWGEGKESELIPLFHIFDANAGQVYQR